MRRPSSNSRRALFVQTVCFRGCDCGDGRGGTLEGLLLAYLRLVFFGEVLGLLVSGLPVVGGRGGGGGSLLALIQLVRERHLRAIQESVS